MKKPLILLTGSSEVCSDIKRCIEEKVIILRVPESHLSFELISNKKPLLICIAPHKDDNLHRYNYSAVMKYSRKTLCPVYAICTHEQYSIISKDRDCADIRHTSLSSFISAVKSSVKFIEENKGDSLALVIARLETMAIMSDNAALASYCENSIHAAGTLGKRIILTSSDYDDIKEVVKNERKCNAFILTENLSGTISDGVTEIAGINIDDKAPVLLVGTNKTLIAPEKVSYINVEDGADNEESGVISAIKKISC